MDLTDPSKAFPIFLLSASSLSFKFVKSNDFPKLKSIVTIFEFDPKSWKIRGSWLKKITSIVIFSTTTVDTRSAAIELYPGHNSITGGQFLCPLSPSFRDELMRLSRDLQAWQFISREALLDGGSCAIIARHTLNFIHNYAPHK